MVRNNKGFTLIELLIVVVIIGILAAIAIPKFAGTKSKAYDAAMKSDLKNFATAQESYFADNNSYGTAAQVTTANLWAATTGVTVSSTDGDGLGWSASATHNGTTNTCIVCAGDKCAPGDIEGEVSCS